jgi:serine O-acetyltransferase
MNALNESLKGKILNDCARFGVLNINFIIFLKIFYIYPIPGLKFMLIFRCLQHFRKRNILFFFLFFIYYRSLKFKYGFDISYRTNIGDGFYIGHFGGIVIHGDSVIGSNCNISQGVTIGVSNHGDKKGTPILGNEIFIGPGAVIIGAITIGNNVTIGANCVINFDVPSNTTVVSSNSIIIDKDLTEYYIQNKYI